MRARAWRDGADQPNSALSSSPADGLIDPHWQAPGEVTRLPGCDGPVRFPEAMARRG